MSNDIPKSFLAFKEAHSDIWQAYNQMGAAVHNAGPLDEKTRGLIKLALSVGAQKEGAVHAHVRKLLELGVSGDEIRQTVLLALPTLGFHSMMAALTWVGDILDE